RPGLETSDPSTAVQRYKAVLSAQSTSFQGKRVMIFGYGGRFDIGVGLLNAGASHVMLCDKYAAPDEDHHAQLFSTQEKYFVTEYNRIRPRPEWMTLVQEDIRDLQLEPVDIVVSNSVYEHLDDVEGITRALAALTKHDGCH